MIYKSDIWSVKKDNVIKLERNGALQISGLFFYDRDLRHERVKYLKNKTRNRSS